MPRLPNGDVIASFLGVREDHRFYDGGSFDNIMLRVGEVQEVIYPDDKRSFSKKFVEYTVYVQHRGNGTAATLLYTNCVLFNPLAGLTDRMVWKLRAAKTAGKTGDGIRGTGSKVLILCLNGETKNAVILGGIRDQDDPRDVDVAEKNETAQNNLGQYLSAVYNGVRLLVNTDGELAITYTGKRKDDGSVDDSVDSNAPGTQLFITKDGNWGVTTKNSKETLKVDHKNKKIILKCDNGVKVGQATDKVLLGSTYRKAQQQLNNQLYAEITGASTALLSAATTMQTATPTTVAAVVASAAASIQAASTQLRQAAQAIKQFENNAQQYLSQNNETD